jgi:hypothetical protein
MCTRKLKITWKIESGLHANMCSMAKMWNWGTIGSLLQTVVALVVLYGVQAYPKTNGSR